MIQILEQKKEQIIKNYDLATATYSNFLKTTAGTNWNDKKEKVSKKYWAYSEKLKAQIAILREIIYIELKREEIEAEKHYLQWLNDTSEELPF
ncbi:MAG: hypothetical protein IJH34_17890 [Romboutsia sp.]|nr:hypothetical protein [Romboutsia sp.]